MARCDECLTAPGCRFARWSEVAREEPYEYQRVRGGVVGQCVNDAPKRVSWPEDTLWGVADDCVPVDARRHARDR